MYICEINMYLNIVKPENVAFIYRFKVYALFNNGGNGATLYRQWFVI